MASPQSPTYLYDWLEGRAYAKLVSADPEQLRSILLTVPFSSESLLRNKLLECDVNSLMIVDIGAADLNCRPGTIQTIQPWRAGQLAELNQNERQITRPDWTWTLNDPRTTAREINKSVTEDLRQIDIRSFVKASKATYSRAIANLCERANKAAMKVSSDIRKGGTEILSFYDEVHKRLMVLNPLARWSVRNGISSGLGHPYDAEEAIAPLRKYLRTVILLDNLTSILEQLEMAKSLLSRCRGEWDKYLRLGTEFLDHIRTESVNNIAHLLFIKDQQAFNKIRLNSTESIERHDFEWFRLAQYTKACVLLERSLLEKFVCVVKLLLDEPAYSSAMAIIHGLKMSRLKDPSLDCFFRLANKQDNYALYRTKFSSRPGIPFLSPHIEELQTMNNSTQQVYIAILRRNAHRSDDVHANETSAHPDLKPTTNTVSSKHPEVPLECDLSLRPDFEMANEEELVRSEVQAKKCHFSTATTVKIKLHWWNTIWPRCFGSRF